MLSTHYETDRVLLRCLTEEDAQGIWELDSNPEVHLFLGNQTLTDFQQAHDIIKMIQDQYTQFGTGRLAAIEKNSGEFMGWAGIKHVQNDPDGFRDYFDLGYRFIPRFWGKGYASECAIASLKIGFESLILNEIYAIAHTQNIASNRVIQKSGFQLVQEYYSDGNPHNRYSITRKNWIEFIHAK